MEKKIKILPGGPYEISGDIPLKNALIVPDEEGASEHWGEGLQYETAEGPYYLCRCGQSANKPFCDGTHKKVGFTGEELHEKKPYLAGCKVYEGATLNLLDNRPLCSSMRFCDKGIGVWDAAIESYTEEKRKLAIEEAAACAAGRLTIVDKKTGRILEPDLPQEVCPIQDIPAGCRGPLWVKGGIPLEGADGESYESRNRMTLCRCGESKNMPFCDISHKVCEHMKGSDEKCIPGPEGTENG